MSCTKIIQQRQKLLHETTAKLTIIVRFSVRNFLTLPSLIINFSSIIYNFQNQGRSKKWCLPIEYRRIQSMLTPLNFNLQVCRISNIHQGPNYRLKINKNFSFRRKLSLYLASNSRQ